MRVLHICHVKRVAGAERHLLNLLPALQASGLETAMLVLYSGQSMPVGFSQPLMDAAIPLFGLRIGRAASNLLNPRAWHSVFQVADIIRQYHPAIVHTHLIVGDFYGIPAARFARVRHVVSTRHNIDRFRGYWYWRLPLLILNGMADRVIAVSDAVKAYVMDSEHLPAGKVTRIHYGITLPRDIAASQLRAELQLTDDIPFIGSVGRLVEQKGFIYGLQAFARLRSTIPNAHYAIVGDGELRSTLQDIVQKMGLGASVHLLGWRDDIPSILNTFDVMLMPSLWEGLPMVALEAMAARLPVIASRVAGLPEVAVEGETALLVPPADVNALEEALLTLLQDRELAKRMGEAGRARVERFFTVEHNAAEIINVYDSL